MTQPTKFLRLPEVAARCGYSRPSIYRLIAEGSFPKPHKLGARASGWRESDIEQWCQSRQEAPLGAPAA